MSLRLWDERVVPRLVDASLRGHEVGELREVACRGLSGRVLEIGFGSGLNVRWYPPEVTAVTAIEPSDAGWALSERRRARSAVPVERAGLDGQRLDLPDASHDSVIITFSLCTIPDPAGKPRMVTSAASFGRLYTDTTLTYDRFTGDIARTAVKSANHVVTRTVAKAPDMTELISKWNTLAAPVGNRAIGYISADVPNTGTESPMGDLIADAQLAYGKGLDPETDLALMNPGGVRAGLTYAAKGSEGDGVVTYAEGFTVQPFSNTVNLQDFTGAQLIQVLKEQVSGSNAAAPKILQPSANLTYTLDLTKTGADRVVTDSIKVNGTAVDPAATYRVATNSFLAGGGDGFTTLGQGTNDLVGADDLAALVQYLTANSSAGAPIAPPVPNRITIVQ